MNVERYPRVLRVLVAIASAAALAVTVCLLGAGTASASTGSCGQGNLCLYQNSNFNDDARGSQWDFTGDTRGYSFPDFRAYGHNLNDNASSMVNNTDEYVYLCRNLGCPHGTDAYLALPHSVDGSFSNNPVTGGGNYNDKFSGLIIEPKGYKPPNGGRNHLDKVP